VNDDAFHHSLFTILSSDFYVRNLGGIPRMFIEYADAGTRRSDECGMKHVGKDRT
jgi:hypothetical protein